MMAQSQHTLSARDAARLIYSNERPTDRQIHQVLRLLQSGSLRGAQSKREGAWRTTGEAVAEFLARRATAKTCGASEDAAGGAARALQGYQHVDLTQPKRIGESDLRATYENAFRDYFMAIIFQRQRQGRSQRFRQAVIAGQAAFLLGFVLLCIALFRPSWVPQSPEQGAVEQWISQNSKSYEILQWYPAADNRQGDGMLVRVKYRYRQERNRSIETDRIFLVNGEHVTVADDD
jgi:hypothetical protein